MKLPLLITVSLVCCLSMAQGQSTTLNLPKGAVVIETRKLASASHLRRTLVLWMLNPKKNPNNYSPYLPYTCPDQTRGSYYSGPARVSLLNSETNTVINTVNISKDDGDQIDVPYAIRKGYYYRVDKAARKGIEARPIIMSLRDYNGDGKALEFALFDALACMGLDTTLVGYSEKQDRVIQYPVLLETIEGTKHSTRRIMWADYLLSSKPKRPGYWKYEIDYRGRAGSLDKWEVRYNSAKEQFEGKLTIVPGEQD